ncbi:Inner membrane protein translocase component YidC, long form [Serinicoccus hydrothermalis]|uniref:Membrane protein insertase YidC n=1 Tax=Serinicoccus hydrothermalis TaxID=1758689 RepID=A0A1B1NF47_9MICO|nr:Inner membrane protein translocase component YidC, long form [Serinicoccus hydrothermalis]
MFAFLDPLLIHVHDLLAVLDEWLPPALVIILVTLAVRFALHPMNRGLARGTVRRRDLQPRIAQLRSEHQGDPRALQQAILELHREEGVSPLPGCLPILIQIPIFSMIYRLFNSPQIDGRHNELFDHTFLGVGLSDHLFTAGAGDRWVFFVLIGLTVLVAAFASRQMRRHMAQDRERLAALDPGARERLTDAQRAMQDSMEQMTKVLPMLSFLTVLAVVSLPLAAGLYLVTSSIWGLLERASLRRISAPPPAPAG